MADEKITEQFGGRHDSDARNIWELAAEVVVESARDAAPASHFNMAFIRLCFERRANHVPKYGLSAHRKGISDLAREAIEEAADGWNYSQFVREKLAATCDAYGSTDAALARIQQLNEEIAEIWEGLSK